MKFLSLVTLLALALTATHAAPCTIKEVEDSSTKPELLAANARCYGVKSDGKANNTDAENKLTCEQNKDCILALTAAISAMPDCTVGDENLRENFKKNQLSLVSRCEKLGVKVSGDNALGSSASVATAVFAVAAAVYAQV